MRNASKSAAVLCAAAIMLVGVGAPALAAEPTDEFDLPAGTACTFPLRIAVFGDGPQVSKTFTGPDGQVRTLTAGRGSALTFTNADTGASISTRSNGGATHTRSNPDGTRTRTLTGHNLVVLFPSDVPPGPSTTVHSGRVVFTLGPDDAFAIQSVTGRQLDVCAALDD